MPHPQPSDELFRVSGARLAASAFYSLAESIPHLVWSSSADRRCAYVNTRWLEFSGSSRNDVVGHDWTEFIHSADLDLAAARWKTATGQGTSFEMECRLRSKTGDYHWFFMRADPLVGSDEIVRWFGTATPLDDRKQLTFMPDFSKPQGMARALADTNARLADENEELEERVALRTRQLRETINQLEAFAYSLAHDMRAPCRALTNYSQILLRDHADRLPKEPRDYLLRISKAADKLDSFVRDLLVYSRVAHDKMPIEEVEVGEILEDVIASSPNFQPPLAHLGTHFPYHSVMANEILLAQCLTNLLTNACKFVKSGEKPSISIYDEKCDDAVRIYVEDHGIGIAEADRERVFNVFERLNPDKEYSGTGIGLSIVRKAVERMGGKVGVTSTPGGGSKFWLELKARPATLKKGTP